MSKVTFEFNGDEEGYDIKAVVNRHKLVSALYDLKDLRREIYKGYMNKENYVIVNQDKTKIINTSELTSYNDAEYEGSKSYIEEEYILNKLDNILSDVYDLLD